MSPASLPPAATVPSLLAERAAARRRHSLLVCDDHELTYEDAARRSAALARGLVAWGAGHGTRIALLYPNGVDFTLAWLAAARIGAVTVPLSTFSTAAELRGLLRNAGVEMVVAAGAYRRHDFVQTLGVAVPGATGGHRLFVDEVPSLRRVAFDSEAPPVGAGASLQQLIEDGESVDPEVLAALERAVRPADRLAIVHTSGSTSEPKGVIHTHGSLISHVEVLNALRHFGLEDVLFCNSPFFWIGGLAYALLGTLAAGATLVCSNSEEPSGVLDLLERTRPTMTNGFVQSIAHLPRHPSFAARDLSSMRRGNLYPIMAEDVRPADPELRHNMLGMTEAGSVCLAVDDETDQPGSRRGSFGRPVPHMEARIVDPGTGSDCGLGEVGVLLLRGPALMEGYCRRERHETFDRDGWYHTGDLFCRDGDDFFYFKGRSGDMIKTSGANVSPREVEAAILAETGLVAHVLGLEDPLAGQIVAAALRLPAGHRAPDLDELRAALRTRLSAYKVPRQLLVLGEEEVPIMSSGKLDSRTLKEMFRHV